MSRHHATIAWHRTTESFAYEAYSRDHVWRFEGGIEVPASASPEYLGRPDRVDPEQALVAALSSCHMLTFVALAAKKRFTLDAYEDAAEGVLEKNAEGRLAITRITLRPRTRFSGERQPTPEDIDRMHERAHQACFIANSISAEVIVEPEIELV